MSNEEQEERDAMEVIILMCFRWLLPDKTILYGEEIVEFLILAGGLQKEKMLFETRLLDEVCTM